MKNNPEVPIVEDNEPIAFRLERKTFGRAALLHKPVALQQIIVTAVLWLPCAEAAYG
jgi:hypothetical protein